MVRILARYGAGGLAVLALIGTLLLYGSHVVRGSDHQDSPLVTVRPGADISDMYVFPSATNSNNVVLAMNVHPIIPPGQGTRTYFDPGVLYQYKIDNTGDFVEDLVIQFKATGVGPNQKITLYGPTPPRIRGRTEYLGNPIGTFNYNQITRLANNRISVFAGPRQDPFFFDLAQFFKIIPDRNAMEHPPFDKDGPPPPSAHSFRGFTGSRTCDSSPAMDFLGGKDLNVLSLDIELPRTMLARSGVPGKVNIWSTAALGVSATQFEQVERFARPAVKEVFTAYDSHDMLNRTIPRYGDPEFKSMIYSFTTKVAGRSPAIANVLATVLTPYVMKVDLSQYGVPAAYLGVETGGATGSKFGGRALKDDIIDISLKAIFGNTVPALGLAPDDHKESPCLQTDNVGPGLHQFNSYFPYLGNPT